MNTCSNIIGHNGFIFLSGGIVFGRGIVVNIIIAVGGGNFDGLAAEVVNRIIARATKNTDAFTGAGQKF